MTDSGAPLPGIGPDGGAPGRTRALPGLADPHTAMYTVGQAGQLLGVPVATLRRLDSSGAVRPGRSAGGQRRYSRTQLEHAQRLLHLVSEGLSLTAAIRVAGLEDEVDELRDRLAGQ